MKNYYKIEIVTETTNTRRMGEHKYRTLPVAKTAAIDQADHLLFFRTVNVWKFTPNKNEVVYTIQGTGKRT